MEKRAKKGRGWHGDSAGHAKAARHRGKKSIAETDAQEISTADTVQ